MLFFAHSIARGPLLRAIQKIVAKTNTQWDDALIERRVLHRLAHLAPGLIIYRLAPLALQDFDQVESIVHTGSKLYLLFVGTITIDALLSAGLDIYRTTNASKEISIKSLIQFVKVILYFVAGLFALSILLKTIVYIHTKNLSHTLVIVLYSVYKIRNHCFPSIYHF